MGERKESWGSELSWDLVEETQGLPGDRTGLFTQPRGREEDFMEEGYPSPNIIQGEQVGVGWGGVILGRFHTKGRHTDAEKVHTWGPRRPCTSGRPLLQGSLDA